MNAHVTFFDHTNRDRLKPLTFMRPMSELRIGILTVREKWEMELNVTSDWLTADYLAIKYPHTKTDDGIFLYGGLMPDKMLIEQLKGLDINQSIWYDELLIAFRGSSDNLLSLMNENHASVKRFICDGEPSVLIELHHLLDYNKTEIEADFTRLSKNRIGEPLSGSIKVIGDLFDKDGKPNVFLETGVYAEDITLNLTKGPVYLGKNCEVMEGSLIRGPVAVCDHAKINMGARIYSGTTIGPWCKAGGEISNSIFYGYSNKGHEGFLGDSVIGEWCNIGADSNNSNLKNDYTEVKLWNYETERFGKTGRQFCGLIMGDYTRCGINTMFNTGTVTGVGVNIAMSGFPRNFVPSFTLTTNKIKPVSFESVLSVGERMMQRRNLKFTDTDKAILFEIYKETEKYRSRL